MFDRFFGARPDEPAVSGLGVLHLVGRRTSLLGGVAIGALACGAPDARANCSATLEPVTLTISNQRFVLPPAALVPFASGGAISSLVSAINASNTAFLTQSSAFIASPPNPSPDQLGGGVWSRGIGGEFTTHGTATSTYGIDHTATGGGVEPLSGNVNCSTTTRLDFAGAQVGTDVARLDWNGWNLHVGQTLGYMGGNAKDVSSAGPSDPSGGTFRNALEIPFVGLYGAATYGGLFIDAQVRWNYYQNNLNDPVQNGLFDQRLDARGFSVTANLGYNYRVYDNWFIEPSAGVVWSRTSVDPLDVPGTAVTNVAGSPDKISFPSTVSIQTIYSTLGRLSLRGGTSLEAGNFVVQPFVTASIFHDFEGNQSTTINTDFSLLGITDRITGALSTTNLGTYGQFGLGAVAQLKDTGWLAYLRGDYRTGSRIEGWSLNGGIRYQFTPVAAVVTGRSADVPAEPVPVAFDWTGPYIGGFLGAAWGTTNWTFRLPTSSVPAASVNPLFAGLLGGGGLGYNYQIGKFILGLEGDFGWTNAKGGRPCPNSFFFSCEDDVHWLSTVTGRVGAVTFDRLLWYVKGGLALGEIAANGRCNTDSQPIVGGGGALLNAGCPAQGTTKTATGWTIGLGGEFALTNNWSVKAETSYFDLGSASYTFDGLNATPVDIRRQGFISRIGLNYRFADLFGAPVVAKY